jgi:hypothetical protein
MRVFEYHLLSLITLLESLITLLESSITLLENIYSTNVARYDCEILIVQATGVWNWHTFSVAPFIFYYYLKIAQFYFRQMRVLEQHLLSSIMLLESLITLLESSITLLEKIYSTDVACNDCEMLIVQATGVWH